MFRRRSFGNRFRRDMDNTPKPIKVGEEYDVEISEVGSKGDGIARIKNFVVFVNNTKPGEKTRVKITEVRNKFGVGEKISDTEVKEMNDEENVEETSEEGSEEEVSEENVEETSEEGSEETTEGE